METELAREAVKVACRGASFRSSRAKTYDNGDVGGFCRGFMMSFVIRCICAAPVLSVRVIHSPGESGEG